MQRPRLSLTAALGLILFACSTEDTDAADATGGKTTSGGTSTLPPGGKGGSGGRAGGTGGAAAGAGNCEETPCTPLACTPLPPPAALLTDFSNLYEGNVFGATAADGTLKPMWWTAFFGGTYVYPFEDACAAEVPPHPLLSERVDGLWHISGTVGAYSGFGLWFEPCMIDTSAYRGLAFDIGGDVGTTGSLSFAISTSGNLEPLLCKTNVGTCDPTEAACARAATPVLIPAEPETVTVDFAALRGGVPEDTVNPAEITAIEWIFDCSSCLDSPYDVDVTIDNVRLIE